jgi:hypothetical protein
MTPVVLAQDDNGRRGRNGGFLAGGAGGDVLDNDLAPYSVHITSPDAVAAAHADMRRRRRRGGSVGQRTTSSESEDEAGVADDLMESPPKR